MRAALIKNDIVENVVIVDSLEDAIPDGFTIEEAPIGTKEIGWVRQEDGTFAPEAE